VIINGYGRCPFQAQGQRQSCCRCSHRFVHHGGDLKGKGRLLADQPIMARLPPVPALEKAWTNRFVHLVLVNEADGLAPRREDFQDLSHCSAI